jgi:RNA-directed DNA polymerase
LDENRPNTEKNRKDGKPDRPSETEIEVQKGVLLPEKLSRLRRKLHQKAKREPKFKFYALYDRIYREDTLEAAWWLVCENNGAPGVDGVSIKDINKSEDGPEQLLREIRKELQEKTYKPMSVRRVYIPKPDGRKRPLGIPTVKDRIVQTAAKLILEPIFEADFLDCSYGFRPERSAHQAMDEIRKNLKEGRREVYDADLEGYFDSIPHDKLMACLKMRIADRSTLRLIRLWLKAPVQEERKKGPPMIGRSKSGTPQGGVISPLLANAYLHYFDRFFYSTRGPATWANAKLVRYADDFVILARYQGKRLQEFVRYVIEERMGLTLNKGKTRIANLHKGDSLDFLGFTFRYNRDLHGGAHKYLNVSPSKKALKAERSKLRERTGSKFCFLPVKELIEGINFHLKHWSRYFRFGYPRKAFRDINHYVRQRLILFMNRKSQRPYKLPADASYYRLLINLGWEPL